MKTEILITADGSPTLAISETGETYHSKHGALAESRHVFIEKGLTYMHGLKSDKLYVFELGFGTGLNAALTLLKATEWKQNVVFHSVELYPPSPDLIQSCAGYYDHDLRRALLKVNAAPWGQLTRLDDHFCIRKDQIDFLDLQLSYHFDVVYYDAFAPSTAPHLWTVECFTKLCDKMNPGAALVTFCAKGSVKRNMRASGLMVERLPGAPGKREMTRAIKLQTNYDVTNKVRYN